MTYEKVVVPGSLLLIALVNVIVLLATGFAFGYREAEGQARSKTAAEPNLAAVIAQRDQHEVAFETTSSVFNEIQAKLSDENHTRLFNRIYAEVLRGLARYDSKREATP